LADVNNLETFGSFG